jgi:predicted RNA-binding Zn ribbon-like protein
VGATAERVNLLIAFLNTVDSGAGADALARPRDYAAWCRARGERPGDLAAARQLRDSLRAMLLGGRAALPDAAIAVAPAAGGGVALAPADLVQSVLAGAAALTLTGDWGRVKLCRAGDCLEAFLDGSRNRSRVWCDMAECGNQAKVRGFRARSRSR